MTLDIKELAGRIVELVRAASPGAQAEVLVDTTDHALTRFANSFIHQNVAQATSLVRVRLHADGRTASGSTTLTDPDGLRALVERTVAAAGLCPPDPQWPGLAPPSPVDGPTAAELESTEPGARAERVRAFVDAAAPLMTAGYVSTTFQATAFANSAGQRAYAQVAQAAMDAIARTGTADGVTRLASRRLSDLDGGRLGARAAAKALASAEPRELPPGRYEVVLEPTAVADLMETMAFSGFNGKAVAERRSFVEPGEPQFDPALFLVDDPIGPDGYSLPFDAEGTPKRRMTLIDAGTSAGVAHDRRTAALAGIESTGHAIFGGAAFGAVPTSLHLLPRTGAAPLTEVPGPAADSAVAELVAQVGRGLLVSDLWYTRLLDPRTMVVTGLTRNGVWLIEDGVITAPVQNFRFTQSYPRALEPGAVLGVGGHAVAVPGGWDVMTYRAPALRLASWNFTGNASG